MPNPSQSSVIECTHERRPGTTVCLHCRAAARVAARHKRVQLLLRGGAVAIMLAVLATAGTFGARVVRSRGAWSAANGGPSAAATAALVLAQTPVTSVSSEAGAVQAGGPIESVAPLVSSAQAAAPPAAPVAVKEAPLAPVLAEGQTVLPHGIVAVRNDSVVTLSFDAPMTRTRIPEKFEQLLRTTLPKVYGPAIDSVLSKLPSGDLSNQGNLVSELPTRGIHVPVKDAWTLAVYPETRPGQDGPLVVRYRVMVVSKN